MALRAQDRRVRELESRRDAAEEKAAPAHVAAPDELGRKEQPLAEHRGEHVDVLRLRDAPEQDDVGVPRQPAGQILRAGFERLAIPIVGGVDVHARAAT